MSDEKNRKHLYYLNELSDFKVDDDDPDVRGWKVKDTENQVIGKVDNLLVSKEKKRVVYLDIEVDNSIIDANHDPYGKPAGGVHEFINKDGENHLILPVGLARLDKDEKCVYSDQITHQTFAETKRVERGYDVDRDYELVVLESYNRDLDNDSASRKDTNRRDTSGMSGNSDPLRTNKSDQIRSNDVRKEGETERLSNDNSFYDRREFERRNYKNNEK